MDNIGHETTCLPKLKIKTTREKVFHYSLESNTW